MSTIDELIERVEKATGPDRGIDAAMFRVDQPDLARSSPWPQFTIDQDEGRDDFKAIPRYTASIDAALALMERKLPGWRISMDQMEDGWDTDLSEPGNRSGVFNATRKTLPLAIILALLIALRSLRQSSSSNE